jgi:hypothetical protein
MASRLVLEPRLVAYLSQRAAALTVRAAPRRGCCGGTVGVPVAEEGAPREPDAYELIERDGIAVYIERTLVQGAGDPITVGIDVLGPWRALWVSGLEGRP